MRFFQFGPMPFAIDRNGAPIEIEAGPERWRYGWEAAPGTHAYSGHMCVRLRVNVLEGEVGVGILCRDRQSFYHELHLGSDQGWREVSLITPTWENLGALVVRNYSAFGISRAQLRCVSATPAFDMYLIYQPGKVASQAIEAALREVLPASYVERHHYLSREALQSAMEAADVGEISESTRRYLYGADGVFEQARAAERTSARISAIGAGKVLIITGVRDPIAHSVSAFFQNIDVYCPWLTYEPDRVHEEALAVLDYYLRQVDLTAARVAPSSAGEAVARQKLVHPGVWFEDEFKRYTGIDIFSAPLGQAPFCTFQGGEFSVLLYRYERLSATLKKMLQAIGLNPFSTPALNVGRDKIYGAVYREFRRLFEVTAKVREVLLENVYTRHFYPWFHS